MEGVGSQVGKINTQFCLICAEKWRHPYFFLLLELVETIIAKDLDLKRNDT